jgi:hypothetical protein
MGCSKPAARSTDWPVSTRAERAFVGVYRGRSGIQSNGTGDGDLAASPPVPIIARFEASGPPGPGNDRFSRV